MKWSEQLNEFSAALATAQGEIKNALMDSQNPHLKNKYANLASVTDAIKAALSKHGISYVQNPHINAADGLVGVNVLLLHKSGQWLEFDPLWCKPAKGLGPQDIGAAMTYLRRYTLSSAVGVTQGAEADDDGETASGRGTKQRQKDPTDQTQATRVANMLSRLAEVQISEDDIIYALGMPLADFGDHEFAEAKRIYDQEKAKAAASVKNKFEVTA
jgi:hypothetical protein